MVSRSQPTVPVAVVGVGNMGRHHARNYAALDRADLRAIVDLDAGRREELARRLGVRAFATVEQLLEDVPEVAAVSVATPTDAHFAVATTLLAAGKHVLVEKPIAPSVAESDELIRLARERSVVLAVGHVERFNPAVRELKARITRGDMGTILSLVARRVGVMPPQVRDANVIVDLAVHDIDIFRYLLEADDPTELHCNAGRAVARDRFDFADIFLRFGEVACFLQVNWLTPVKIRSLAATGTKGYAELEYVRQELAYHPAQPIAVVDSFAELDAYSRREPERPVIEHREPLAAELEEFLKAASGEQAEVVPGEEGRASMAIAARLTELAEQRRAA